MRVKNNAAGVAGVDIDLRRCHVWHEKKGRMLYKGSDDDLLELMEVHPDWVFLVECASPHIYGLTQAALYNKLRWLIYNSYVIGRIGPRDNVLISPSSVWKHSWSEEEMMRILDIEGDNHDIRQCRAMCRLYRMHPGDWVSTRDFFKRL